LGTGQVFPYGFDLAAQPHLGGRIVLGTTAAVVLLDPATGAARSYRLPIDGTNYWPYEIAVSGGSAIIETNVGAVLVTVG